MVAVSSQQPRGHLNDCYSTSKVSNVPSEDFRAREYLGKQEVDKKRTERTMRKKGIESGAVWFECRDRGMCIEAV